VPCPAGLTVLSCLVALKYLQAAERGLHHNSTLLPLREYTLPVTLLVPTCRVRRGGRARGSAPRLFRTLSLASLSLSSRARLVGKPHSSLITQLVNVPKCNASNVPASAASEPRLVPAHSAHRIASSLLASLYKRARVSENPTAGSSGVSRHALMIERECCLLVLDSVTSTPQWIRQPKPRDVKR
jgi:hypothetical protein